ncbi:hypothetical protein Nepgr_024289 [Nepenthes gracilis]|uniref:Uncharacterized protein n=1 Tax=Nepenthes gracilis TaxID=150966 RepID=A0AAD3T5S6_NEPGR|nr:hypothetical protein Nepgr_024289 [Nepenthes gracilis]
MRLPEDKYRNQIRRRCMNTFLGRVDLLEERNMSLAEMQASYDLQIKQLKVEPEKEQDKSANIHSNCKNAHLLESCTVKEELERSLLKLEKDLKEMHLQTNKALQELAHLKLHLLDKRNLNTMLRLMAEAKERLEGDLSSAREERSKFSQLLRVQISPTASRIQMSKLSN